MLLPISTCPFEDFRPTIQAAWQMLWGERRFPAGSWDDLSIWLGGDTEGILAPEHRRPKSAHFPQAGLFITQANDLKTVLRAVDFRNRPGHSDQLHMDIWYQGVNLARDPGTYLYNAQPPWDNSLSGAWCHNTVGLDHREPMLKAGRFLWLDWSRADVIELRKSENSLIEVFFARHRSGRWSGSLHQRTVAILGKDLIIVADDILGKGEHDLILNWSLADLKWQIEGSTITLQHENFLSTLSWSVENRSWGLYRAGEGIGGEAVVENPTIYGWHAPTYAQKMPGLQLVVQTRQMLPARMISTWTFQDADLGKLHVNWLPIEEKRVAFDSLQWGSEEWVS
jgi:asparagine synthase (glutamine-hydrolysing)